MNDVPKSRFQFGVRTLLEIIAVVAIVLALVYGSASRTSGNFELYMMPIKQDPTGRPVIAPEIALLEKHSGRLWVRFTGGMWQEWSRTDEEP